MISRELLEDILRLILRIGEEVIGLLPENFREAVAEKRREVLEAILDICKEQLDGKGEARPDLTSVPIQ